MLEHPDDFGKHATLSLHNLAGGIPDELNNFMPKVKVFQETFDHQRLHDFYALNHMLLAPSLGEGKNLPALEMLATGGTVAASTVGGHTMWLRDDIAYPLPWEKLPLHGERMPKGPQVAQVSVASLKAAMWDAYSDRATAKARASWEPSSSPSNATGPWWSSPCSAGAATWSRATVSIIYQMAQECHRPRYK